MNRVDNNKPHKASNSRRKYMREYHAKYRQTPKWKEYLDYYKENEAKIHKSKVKYRLTLKFTNPAEFKAQNRIKYYRRMGLERMMLEYEIAQKVYTRLYKLIYGYGPKTEIILPTMRENESD